MEFQMSRRTARTALMSIAIAGVGVAAVPSVANATPPSHAMPQRQVRTVEVTKRSRKETKAERERAATVAMARAAFNANGSAVAIHNQFVDKVARVTLARLAWLHRVRIHKAINFAMAQLGKPYVFNANGPNAWDCSGLTAGAYKAAGIWMDDYSGSQFNAFPHVPLDQLQPGDLVFLGPGGTQHVALYIGYGLQIAAPHTGTVVQIQPLMPNLTGAVRPA
jgi:cell wall-associated NlpC family hydrolase